MSQPLVAAPMGQQTEAADADEPPWEDVLHKAPQELVGRERHSPPAMAVGIGLVAECDLAVLQGLDPVVADGHAVRVARQVFQGLFGTVVWWFGVDGPFFLVQR